MSHDLLPLAPMIIGAIIVAGWALYFRDREDVQRDWLPIATLVLTQVMVIIAAAGVVILQSAPSVIFFFAVLAFAIWARVTSGATGQK